MPEIRTCLRVILSQDLDPKLPSFYEACRLLCFVPSKVEIIPLLLLQRGSSGCLVFCGAAAAVPPGRQEQEWVEGWALVHRIK